MKTPLLLTALLLGLATVSLPAARAQTIYQPSRETAIELDNLDPAAYSQWVDGSETPVVTEEVQKDVPQWLLWTRTTNAGHAPVSFGDSKTPGARHLRIGFKAPVEVGSVLTIGGGSFSVLKPDAAYPGDMSQESNWLPAQRLVNGQPSRAEAGPGDYALWVLPPNTQTRALRFSHVAAAADPGYRGSLGAAQIWSERQTDLAPLAVAAASGENQYAAKINDGNYDLVWDAWGSTNRHETPPATQPIVSAKDPVFVTLTWPMPVKLDGLATIWTGFANGEAQIYTGPADGHPRDAPDGDWQTVKSFEGFYHAYPLQLFPLRIEFGKTVTTRAVRLRITKAVDVAPYHAPEFTKTGKRVWLGELMALSPQGNAPLQTVAMPAAPKTDPPIPIRFKIDKPGFVTLVIQDQSGRRVRNLIAETPFPAGDNVVWWDGTDDLGRDVEAASHGIYKIPQQFVKPGQYKVRGLVRDAITPRYEFSFYNAGDPAWETPDKTGGWLTNHTPPQAALFLDKAQSPTGEPLVYLGSYISEGGSGLAWVDLNGKKVGGRGWVGGNWTAAPFLARDNGANALPDVTAYVASAWTNDQDAKIAELRVTGLTKGADKPILKSQFAQHNVDNPDPASKTDITEEIAGLAVHDGTVVVAMPLQKQLWVADAKSGEIKSRVPLEEARGLAFDKQGNLLVISGQKVLRTALQNGALGAFTPVVSTGLEAPQGIVVGEDGKIYVSDWGQSHQVKVFDATGKLLRSIGHAGAPKAGPYDELHMNHPTGLALDSNGRVWVTEKDYLPKRVSVWNADGKLWKSFYGPAKYGGGGMLDPRDPNLLLYADESRGSMEFKLDWKAGTSRLQSVFYRPDADALKLGFASAAPETAIYANKGRYFSNSFNSHPTNGAGINFIWKQKDGIAHPVAAMGLANNWDVLKDESFKTLWPEGFDPRQSMWANFGKNQALFAWTDENGDEKVQLSEVTIKDGQVAGLTVMPDLAITVALFGDKSMRFAPVSFTGQGAPRYDISKGEVLLENAVRAPSDGGDQVLTDGKTTFAASSSAGFAPFSFSGKSKDGVWSYPNMWPGLHPSHEAPVAVQPGELLGPTRILGGLVTPPKSDAGPLVAINSNLGMYYLFTADGLFAATLFNDFRQAPGWSIPTAIRNTDVSKLSQGPENFWPTWGQAPGGQIYVVDGGHSSILRLDGLETIKRLPPTTLNVSAADLQKAQDYLVKQETTRQKVEGGGTLQVALSAATPTVDGKLDDWANAKWVDIDKSGVAAFFNSNSKPYDVTGALTISGDRLYAAYRTGNEQLLQNSGEVPTAPFKTGGALDLMIGTNADADPKRTVPVAGDVRLIVTMVKDKPLAVLYRAVVAGATEKVPFSSPWRTITFDEVRDVSDQIQLAGEKGDYEFSIPLSVLGLKPQAGQELRGDIGVLRGNGMQTTARVYWSNKATGIVSDVPSEAMLTPQLWGRLTVGGD